ncbi:Bcr/CflA family efflux MFS transporter [Pusillimonas sp. TS35]|uniref:multidrug effflux MFS transporter n=1 Tax=Paracandidimonas lactea TaxID=2895524 RepID=UPI00136BBCB6|nr:multidrug effflux MFS transporter [Paracandidimonas lactea]MYN11555.1 Bcr/CflA family efflux MFS transporter [Pusillimonas sp. TS35]
MGLLTALGPLAIDMYLPAFSAIASSLGATRGEVERTLAIYLLGLSCAQLFYGPFADRYGRKAPLLVGLALYTTAAIGCALSTSIGQLTFWRVAQAFGGAAGIVIPRAVIRDNFETRDAAKALSILMLVMGVTPILAPILGGQVLLTGSWRGIFAIMAVGSGALLIAVALRMRETLDPASANPLHPSVIALNYMALARHKQFLCYSLAGGFGSAGMFAYISGSPRVFIDVFGVQPKYFGLLFGLNAACLIFASQVSARLLSRHTPETLLGRAQISLAIMTLVGVALTMLGLINLPLLMLCLMGFMASQGFVNPNAAALALAGQGHRLGVASAMMGTLQMLCGALSGFAVSVWQSDTPLPLTGVLAVCACGSWLFGRIALRAA